MIGWNETAGFPILLTERLLLREFTHETKFMPPHR